MELLRRKTDGSITVFFALVLGCILSLLLTCLEGARFTASRALAEEACAVACESVLSDYYLPLFERYGIFGFNAGFDGAVISEPEIEAMIEMYMGPSVDPEGNFALSEASSGSYLFESRIDDVSIKSVKSLCDDAAEPFISQVKEYEVFSLGEKLIEELFSNASELKGSEKKQALIEEGTKTSEKLAVLDLKTLELMGVVDGLSFSDGNLITGIRSVPETRKNFVKRLMVSDVTSSNAGINNQSLFNVMVSRYENPGKYLSAIGETGSMLYSARLSLHQAEETISEFLRSTSGTSGSSDPAAALAFSLALESLEEQRSSCAAAVTRLETDLSRSAAEFLDLLNGTKEACHEAVSVIDSLEAEKLALQPVVSGFEEFLESSKDQVDDALFENLGEGLELMKSAVGITPGDLYDYVCARETLQKNISILEKASSLAAGISYYPEGMLTSEFSKKLNEISKELQGYSYSGLFFDYSGINTEGLAGKAETALKQTVSEGIASWLTGKNDISEKVLRKERLPSSTGSYGSLCEAAGFEEVLEEKVGELADRGAVSAYGTQLFSCFTDRVSPSGSDTGTDSDGEAGSENKKTAPAALSYEREYLICGSEADSVNLLGAAGMILGLRLVPSAIFVFGSPSMQSEAAAFAASAVGLTFLPFLVTAVKYAVLTLWAFEQAVVESVVLLRGKKVPVLTSERSCVVTFADLFAFNKEVLADKLVSVLAALPGECSLDYGQYLTLFLLMSDTEAVSFRMLDLIQENLRIRKENFLIANCLTQIRAEAKMTVPARFSNVIPGAAGFSGGYSFSVTESACYR